MELQKKTSNQYFSPAQYPWRVFNTDTNEIKIRFGKPQQVELNLLMFIIYGAQPRIRGRTTKTKEWARTGDEGGFTRKNTKNKKSKNPRPKILRLWLLILIDFYFSQHAIN